MRRKIRGLIIAALALGAATALACISTQPGAGNRNVENSNATAAQSASDKSPNKEKPAAGSIEVTSTPPGAAIALVPDYEGGAGLPQSRGSTPTTITDVAVGKYLVQIGKPGYRSYQKNIEVKENSAVKVDAKLKKQ